MRHPVRAGFALVVVLLGGCGEPAGPLLACNEPVEMTLTTESTLRIRWTPRCGATELTVMKPSNGGLVPVWQVTSPEATIPPDVRLFQMPLGTTAVITPGYPPGPAWVVHVRAGSVEMAHGTIGF